MSPLSDLFRRKASPHAVDHPLFGRITFGARRGWERTDFEFWGFHNVHLMIDAGPEGPTPIQEERFRRLRDRRDLLLPQCLAAVAEQRAETQCPSGTAFVSALSIPALGGAGPAGTGELWTLWFDYEGEEHWGYGVQSSDDWQTLSGFSED